MSIWTDNWEGLYEDMEEARVSALFGRTAVSRCLCSGIEVTRESTDNGGLAAVAATLRYLQSDDPATGSELGNIVAVTAYGATKAANYRIMGKLSSGGVITLTLEAVHG